MKLDSLKRQIELARLRQKASRIALRLFEAAKSQADIDDINVWFCHCNTADTKEDVEKAIQGLLDLAASKNISINL